MKRGNGNAQQFAGRQGIDQQLLRHLLQILFRRCIVHRITVRMAQERGNLYFILSEYSAGPSLSDRTRTGDAICNLNGVKLQQLFVINDRLLFFNGSCGENEGHDTGRADSWQPTRNCPWHRGRRAVDVLTRSPVPSKAGASTNSTRVVGARHDRATKGFQFVSSAAVGGFCRCRGAAVAHGDSIIL